MNAANLEQDNCHQSKFSRTSVASISDKETILNILIALIGQKPVGKPFPINQEMSNEVMFESDIDGTHYYVIKSRPKSSQHINLSPREKMIAKLVAQGLSNKSIANQLQISHWTVATYLRRIFSKLGVTSRTEMITHLFQESVFDRLELI